MDIHATHQTQKSGSKLKVEVHQRLHKSQRHKKLHLVLDLDNTLLHTADINENNMVPSVKSSFVYCPRPDIYTDSIDDRKNPIITKLRPFVRTFLEEANQMFQMHIYTMGNRHYAKEMISFLDPKKVYFGGGSRIISKDDTKKRNRKGLDLIPAHESCVIILDDLRKVWRQKDIGNLIHMQEYKFWEETRSGLQFNFKETDEALSIVLKVLKRVYDTYFSDGEEDRDVRNILNTIRMEVLQGCKIVFSDKLKAVCPKLWKMAEKLGAECSTELDPLATHVVSVDIGTEESGWAVKEKKFLVHPGWIGAAKFLWRRQPEGNFTLE